MRPKVWMAVALTVAASMCGVSVVQALDGALDRTFGRGGMVLTPDTSMFGPERVLLQPDGKIVVVGSCYPTNHGEAVVMRYMPDGTLDPTFGVDGRATATRELGLIVSGAALQSDGKVIVVGSVEVGGPRPYPLAVLRFNVDGSLDETFGTDGFVSSAVDADWRATVVVRADGTFMVGVQSMSSVVLLRYMTDGTLDPTFDGDGKVDITFDQWPFGVTGLAADGDTIVVVGWKSAIGGGTLWFARYRDDGTLDAAFGTDGIAVVAPDPGGSPPSFGWTSSSVVLRADGRIVVGVSRRIDRFVGHRMALVQLLPSGELDTAFGVGGFRDLEPPIMREGDSEVTDLALQADGGIVLVGRAHEGWEVEDLFSHMIVVRVTVDGDLDSTFGAGGYAIVEDVPGTPRLALLPDGRILLGAAPMQSASSAYGVLLVRLNANANGPGIDPRVLPETGSSSVVALLALVLVAVGAVLVVGARRARHLNTRS